MCGIIVYVLHLFWRRLSRRFKLWCCGQSSSLMVEAAEASSSSNGNPMEPTPSSSTHWSSSSNLTRSHGFVRNAHNDQRGPELRDSNIRSRSPSPRRVAANNQTRREYANRIRLQALERQIDIIQDHLRAVNHALEAIALLLNAGRVPYVPPELLLSLIHI